MSFARLLFVSMVLTLCGCAHEFGPQLENFRPAQTAAGISAEIKLRRGYVPGNRLTGEIVAVSEDSVLLLLNRPLELSSGHWRFVEPSFRMMRSIDLGKAGKSVVKSEGQAIDDARLDRLRLLSRFPQGLSGPLKLRLLETYGESGVWVPIKQ